MVTSAAVPAVVGTATVKVAWFLVRATPSRETTSENSGFSAMTPMALAVSMEEPPPTATMASAPEASKAATPAWTFSTVGLGFTSEKSSQGMPAPSSTSHTLAAMPALTRPGSVHTKTLDFPRRSSSPGISATAPGPW